MHFLFRVSNLRIPGKLWRATSPLDLILANFALPSLALQTWWFRTSDHVESGLTLIFHLHTNPLLRDVFFRI